MKKKILFVDDEPNIIEGLERMLRNMRDEWDMVFTNSGPEALKILEGGHFDIIVSDMRMPGMDGAELLEEVQGKYPQIIRIILSGHSDQDMIMRSAKFTHQFLAKPFDSESLKLIINRTYQIRYLLTNETLRSLVGGINNLPSLLKLYNQIVKELQSPDASVKRVGDLIAQDVAMTAEILKLVNSAFFSLPNRVNSPQQAASILGIDILKGLVLYTQFFTAFKDDPLLERFMIDDLWKHSLIVGNLAKEITHLEVADKRMENDALIAGMLHDIGKIVLVQVPEQYYQVYRYAEVQGCSGLVAEYHILGASHAELGAYLLGLWGNSDAIVEAIMYHHMPSNQNGTGFSVLTAVHVANVLSTKDEPQSALVNAFDFDDLYLYLSSLNLLNRLPVWQECYDNLKRKELSEK